MQKQPKYDDMDKIYNSLDPELIPWNFEEAPHELKEIVESGMVEPCKAVDLGCGMGNYAVYMAKKGFDMTGIDISPKALDLASENAKKNNAVCKFIVADLIKPDLKFVENFDFAYDWDVFHHIFPEDRQIYLENVSKTLNKNGKYLSICFHENNKQFGGNGKYRKTPLGTTLYFSSQEELTALYSKYFRIFEFKIIEIPGKYGMHLVNYFFMEKKLEKFLTI